MSRVGVSTPGTAAAYQAAVKRLRDEHHDQFEAYHAEERAKRGLDPTPGTVESLRAENERLRAELAALRNGGES